MIFKKVYQIGGNCMEFCIFQRRPVREAGRAEFNVATPTYGTVACSVR